MKNRIKCLLSSGAGPSTAQALASKINCDLKLLNYLIDNPDEELPFPIAQAISGCYNIPLEFVLGHPICYKLKTESLPHDLVSDLRKMKEEKPYYEYRWRKGCFKNTGNLTSSYKGTAFIAMSFKTKDFPELVDIRKAFKTGIEKAGYLPVVVDEIQTNEDITFTIFESIKKSCFLVLDTTYENFGAYYEAGYARGAAKNVIICCKQSKFDERSDHFDINHINHILWNDTDDLATKLTERILKTVG